MGIRIVFPEDEYEDDGQMLYKASPKLWIGDKSFHIKSIMNHGDEDLHIEFVVKGSDVDFGKQDKEEGSWAE